MRERSELHELEVALSKLQQEQRAVIEDILRANALASDNNAETTLKIRKL